MTPRFQIVHESNYDVIRDMELGRNIFFIAEGGHGPSATTTRIAEAVVEFLNTMPEDWLR